MLKCFLYTSVYGYLNITGFVFIYDLEFVHYCDFEVEQDSIDMENISQMYCFYIFNNMSVP